EPAPARAELADAGGDEVLLHLLDRAEILLDLLLERRGKRTAALGLHPFPEMRVVVVLPGIVEEGGVLAMRALDDLLEALALPFGALQQGVAGVHIGEVMLVMMEFERLLRHMGRQRIMRIGEVGKRKRHVGSPGIASGWGGNGNRGARGALGRLA